MARSGSKRLWVPSVQGALFFAFLLFTFDLAAAQGLPLAAPGTVGMSAERLNPIDALVEADLKEKKLPGAVVLVGHKGKIVFRRAYGNRSLVPTVGFCQSHKLLG